MKKLLTLILIGSLIFGCDDWLDVNTDPNNPTEVGPDLILPVAQNYTARWIQRDRRVSHLGNMIMYNWSESAGFSWYNDEFQYRANATTFYSNIFDEAYSLSLKQYSDLDELDPAVYSAYLGISKIMKAYHFQILVDFYGDIPYSEALKRSEIANPKYDDAQAVYDNLITDLTDAIELIAAAETGEGMILPGDDDIMFGGDLTSWKQFANTIKLRILNRESSVKDNAYVTEQLTIIANEGSGYITEDVVVNPGYLNEENKQNPIWADFGADVSGTATLSGKATCASDFIIDYLESTDDPRIDYLYEHPATGHLGVPQGITSSNDVYAPELVSNIGPGILIGSTQGAVIFTVAESYFNQAELALNGFGGSPESLYNMGVTSAFESLGLTSVDADDYLSQNQDLVSYASSTDKLEAIIVQKWIAVNGRTAEQSWFDWSRTGMPDFLPVSQELPNLKRPYRLSYPASETGSNSVNVPSQPDVFTVKIFWGN